MQFSAAYSTGKALVPLPHSVINALENTMSDLGGSLISSAAQQSEKARCYTLHTTCRSYPGIMQLHQAMRTGDSSPNSTLHHAVLLTIK